MKPANRLKELREARKLTVRELAVLVSYHLDGNKKNAETHFTYISKHETGAKPLTPEYLKAYSKVFKCETHELLIAL